MRKYLAGLLLTMAIAGCGVQAPAATCPGQETQVVIPLTGATNILPADLFCSPLAVLNGASTPVSNFTVAAVKAGAIAQPTILTAASPAGFPSVTYDAAGIHLSVNGISPGSQWSLTFTYLPANVTLTVPGYAGAQVTGMVLTD